MIAVRNSLFLLLCLFLFGGTALAQTVDELIKSADQFATKEFNNKKAEEVLLKAEKQASSNYEVLWRLSRTYVDIGEHMPSNTGDQEDAQLAVYQKALNYSDKAIKLAPAKSICYLRRAIANGRIALFQGVFSVAGTVEDVKSDLEKAISLGNGGKEVQSTSHYVLGKTHLKLCDKPYLVRLPLGLGWGDIEVAIQEFTKAIELRGNFRMIHLDLAKAYIEEDEYVKAREHLNKIPTLPILDEDDYSVQQEAANLLKEIKDE